MHHIQFGFVDCILYILLLLEIYFFTKIVTNLSFNYFHLQFLFIISNFMVGPGDGYTLSVGGYSGDAGKQYGLYLAILPWSTEK